MPHHYIESDEGKENAVNTKVLPYPAKPNEEVPDVVDPGDEIINKVFGPPPTSAPPVPSQPEKTPEPPLERQEGFCPSLCPLPPDFLTPLEPTTPPILELAGAMLGAFALGGITGALISYSFSKRASE